MAVDVGDVRQTCAGLHQRSQPWIRRMVRRAKTSTAVRRAVGSNERQVGVYATGAGAEAGVNAGVDSCATSGLGCGPRGGSGGCVGMIRCYRSGGG